MDEREDLLNIGAFSLVTRLTRRALRLYEEKGLLVPARRGIQGYRHYSYAQIPLGLRLRRLAEMGFGLREMRTVLEALEAPDGDAKVESLFEKRLGEVESEVKRLHGLRDALLAERSWGLEKMDKMEPSVKEIPGTRVVSGREKGTYGEVIPRLIAEICGQVASPENQRAGARFAGPPAFICHDMYFKEKDADIEVVVPVVGRLSVDPKFEVRNLEGGSFASVVYRGPYDNVHAGYQVLFQYIGKSGYKIAGPCRELYLNDPNNTSKDELLTEVQIPIKK